MMISKMIHTDADIPRYEIWRRRPTLLISVLIEECEALIEHTEFLKGFSERELSYISAKAKGSHSLAARYAAKRGAELISNLPWYCFEVARGPEGIPHLKGREERTCAHLTTAPIILSLTHDEPYALAYLFSTSSPR